VVGTKRCNLMLRRKRRMKKGGGGNLLISVPRNRNKRGKRINSLREEVPLGVEGKRITTSLHALKKGGGGF